MAIKIVTDSAADLPPDLARELDITVVPCNVVLGDVNYKDGVDIGPDEFYRRLVSDSGLPTTSQPSVADFQAVYRELAGKGHSIVSVHPSAKVSGTMNSASQARESLADADIHVIDSGMASIAEGLVVVERGAGPLGKLTPPRTWRRRFARACQLPIAISCSIRWNIYRRAGESGKPRHSSEEC